MQRAWSSTDLQHRQVRTWTVTAASRRPALVLCTPAGPVQTGGDRPLLSPEPSAIIPRRSLCSCLRRRRSLGHLRSAARHQLTVPRIRRLTFGSRAFATAGPTVWNSLPISDIQLWDQSSFGVTWKPICLVSALRRQRSRCFCHHLRYTHVHLPAYHLLTHY